MLFLMFFGIIFGIVNGQYLFFDGKCPDPLPTKDFLLSDGKFYVIAETINGTTRSDIVISAHFQDPNSDELEADILLRASGDDCQHILATLRQVDNKKYEVISSKHDDIQDSFVGFLVYFLSDDVRFICFDIPDKNQFQAKVFVSNKDPVDFDSDQRNEVESILAENKLEFMNEYFSSVTQDNPCPDEI